MAHLVHEVRGVLGEDAAPATAPDGVRERWWIAAAAVVALAAMATRWQPQRSPAPRRVAARSSRRASPAARAQINGHWQAESPMTGTTPASASVSRSPARPTAARQRLVPRCSRAACSKAASMARASASSPGRAKRAGAAAPGGRASLPGPARRRRASLRHADRGRHLAARADRFVARRVAPGPRRRRVAEARPCAPPICKPHALLSRRTCTSSRRAGRA